MALEPLAGEPRNLFQSSGLLEQMGRSGNDHQLLLASELPERLLVEGDHRLIIPADDEQCPEPGPSEELGHVPVSATVPAAPAAVRE